MRHTFKPYQKYTFFDDSVHVAHCPKCGKEELFVNRITTFMRSKPFDIHAKVEPDGFYFADQLPDRYQDEKDMSTMKEQVYCEACGWHGGLLMEGTEDHYKALKKQGRGFRDYLEDTEGDPDNICARPKCPEENTDGEGFDGYCGTCADKGYGERTSG